MITSSHPIQLKGNVFFASDFHLGTPDAESSRERETLIVRWLSEISPVADYLFLLGDIFDFWFEYKDVVPKGYYSLFAKFAEMRAKGIEIYFFTGNHDMWVKDYFEKEFGMKIFREEQLFEINGKLCLIGHGDGLDPKDKGYLFVKKLFAFRPNIVLYGALPPRWAFAIARACSRRSRAQNLRSSAKHRTKRRDKEKPTLEYIRQCCSLHPIDMVVYGHRHLPLKITVNERVTYYNTGDWLYHNSYLQWVDGQVQLLSYPTNNHSDADSVKN